MLGEVVESFFFVIWVLSKFCIIKKEFLVILFNIVVDKEIKGWWFIYRIIFEMFKKEYMLVFEMKYYNVYV